MKKFGSQAVLFAGLLVIAMMVSQSTALGQSATRPPQNLKLVGDHWTPWDPPPAGPGDYIIVKGDTLWDLAGRWLGDPFLWPQVWDQNRYILDSHWIYPGDPLVVPGRPTVVPDDGPPPGDDLSGRTPAPPEVARSPMSARQLLPVANATDLYCSGYIAADHRTSDLWIGGVPSQREDLGEGDVFYMNKGSNQGISAGDTFAIVRPSRTVVHPSTNQEIGSFIRRLGRARVMLTQDNTSTAVIEMSCAEIRESDELLPWIEIPAPMVSELPPFDRWDVTESGGPSGAIVTVLEGRELAAEGQIIYTDLGSGSGVQPGEVLTLYRDNTDRDYPRTILGQAIILTVESTTSTARIMRSVQEMTTGDRVEVVR